MQRALTEIHITRARHYAKWSCVKNPYDEPRYVLPYGFIQSPALATLVLMLSPVGDFLRAVHAQGEVTVSVYMDDISLSSDDETALNTAFAQLKENLQAANFRLSKDKVRLPSPGMDVFNCDLSPGKSEVQQARIDLFHQESRSAASEAGFSDYCERVADGNT